MKLSTINESLEDSIQKGEAYAVVDGSFDPNKKLGTACWIITDNQRYKNKGLAQATGPIGEMEPYRAELFGIFILLLYIYIVTTSRYKMDQWK